MIISNAVANQAGFVSRKLAAWITEGLMLTAALAAVLYFRTALPVGEGPAGPTVAREPFAVSWTTRPVLVVGLGDSVTAGFGARQGFGYFDRVIRSAPGEPDSMAGLELAAVLPNLRSTNLAVSGSTSFELIKDQLPRLAVAESNLFGLVLITTGGNDLIHNYGRTPPREQAMYGATFEQAQPWIEGFEARLEQIVLSVSNRFPGGCMIYLGNIYDPSDGTGDLGKVGLPPWRDGLKILAGFNRAIERVAEKHGMVHRVDLHRTFLGHGVYCTHFWRSHYDRNDPHYWYFTNLEDPNERGYDAIRRLFLGAIAENRSGLK